MVGHEPHKLATRVRISSVQPVYRLEAYGACLGYKNNAGSNPATLTMRFKNKSKRKANGWFFAQWSRKAHRSAIIAFLDQQLFRCKEKREFLQQTKLLAD